MKSLILVSLVLGLISCVPKVGDYYTEWQEKTFWESQTTTWTEAKMMIYEPTLVTKSVSEFTNWGSKEWNAHASKVGDSVTIELTLTLTTAVATWQGQYVAGCIFSTSDKGAIGSGNTGVCFVGRLWGPESQIDVFMA